NAVVCESGHPPLQGFLHFRTRTMHDRAQVTQDRFREVGGGVDIRIDARIGLNHYSSSAEKALESYAMWLSLAYSPDAADCGASAGTVPCAFRRNARTSG